MQGAVSRSGYVGPIGNGRLPQSSFAAGSLGGLWIKGRQKGSSAGNIEWIDVVH